MQAIHIYQCQCECNSTQISLFEIKCKIFDCIIKKTWNFVFKTSKTKRVKKIAPRQLPRSLPRFTTRLAGPWPSGRGLRRGLRPGSGMGRGDRGGHGVQWGVSGSGQPHAKVWIESMGILYHVTCSVRDRFAKKKNELEKSEKVLFRI